MSLIGISPRNGLAPGVRNSGIPLTAPAATGCEIVYYDEVCPPKFDAKQQNHLISEYVALYNAAAACSTGGICGDEGFVYDCTRPDNLTRALAEMYQPKFHFGPCSDYADGNISSCATVWVQEDACRHVFRHGDFWVEEGGPGLTFVPAPAAAFPYWTNGQVVTDQYGKERSYDQACNTLAIAAQGTGVLTDNGDCTFTYDDGNGNVLTDGDPVTIDIGACAGGGLDYDEHPNAHTWAAVGGPGPVGSQFNQVLTRFKANVGDPWQYNWVPIVGTNDDP